MMAMCQHLSFLDYYCCVLCILSPNRTIVECVQCETIVYVPLLCSVCVSVI